MDAMTERLLQLWVDARLAEKDGFFLMLGGGSIGMPWWNREHVNAMVSTWRALPKHTQTAFLHVAVSEKLEVENEG